MDGLVPTPVSLQLAVLTQQVLASSIAAVFQAAIFFPSLPLETSSLPRNESCVELATRTVAARRLAARFPPIYSLPPRRGRHPLVPARYRRRRRRSQPNQPHRRSQATKNANATNMSIHF